MVDADPLEVGRSGTASKIVRRINGTVRRPLEKYIYYLSVLDQSNCFEDEMKTLCSALSSLKSWSLYKKILKENS